MIRARGLALSFAIALCLFCLAPTGCHPADPLAEVRRQQGAGDFAGSLEPLRALLEERRSDPEVQYLYGRALVATGQPTLADWALRQAMESPQWLLPAGLQLITGAIAAKAFPLAIETADRILEVHPDNVEVRLLRANALAYSRMAYEETLAEVDRIFALDPDNIEAMGPRILALLGLERIDEAAEAIAELGRRIDAQEVGDTVPGWHCATTALFAYESGDFELADKRWQRCLEIAPAFPNVVENALDFYDARGASDQSIEILRNALREAPASRRYRLMLAGRLRDLGQKEEAEGLLRGTTESEDPMIAAVAWLDLAKHFQTVGDFAAAAQAVDHSVERLRVEQEPPPQLLLEQADAQLLAGEYDRALAIADTMTLKAHQEMIRARVAQERGHPAEALAHFDAAFLLWPDNPWARYSAALAAEDVGDFDRAIDEYRNVLRIDLVDTDTRTRLARLHLAEGKVADAVEMLRTRVDRVPLDLEAELLLIRLWAQLGLDGGFGSMLEGFQANRPAQLGEGVASAMDGIRVRSGAAAALAALRQWESKGLIDFANPLHADALRALVRLSSEAGQGAAAEPVVRSALQGHPDVAALHEILGLQLELAGAPAGAARTEYERALALDAGNARALAGLGRLALGEDPRQALVFFDRAAAADPSDADVRRNAARALVAAGEPLAAEERLDALLKEHPYDADAASELVALQLARGEITAHTLERAQRAVRFGGGAEALDLLSEVHERRNEPELARAAAERAAALRAPGSS